MINFMIVFFNGILAGLSGCIFMIFPILLKYIYEEKKDSRKGLFLFSFGLMLSQFFIFSIINIFSSFLRNYIVFFQSLMTIIAGVLLFFIFYMSQFKDKNIISKSTKRKNNLFLYGFFFGFTLTSCSFGFLVGSLGFSFDTNIIGALLNGLIFSIGLILPILILAFFFNSLNLIVDKYQKHYRKIKTFSNYILLLLSYYFLYQGFSSLNLNQISKVNLFWLNVVIFIYVIISLFLSILNFNDFKLSLILKIFSIIGLIGIFIFHCFFRSESCMVCTLSDFKCQIELILFILFTIVGLFSEKISNLLSFK